MWGNRPGPSRDLERVLEAFKNDFEVIAEQIDKMQRRLHKMPTRADLDAAKAALKQAITDAAARVSADIQALRDQLANGQPITDADLSDLQSDVEAVAQIDAPPTP